MSVAVYRIYDASERLLYVGQSANPMARVAAHSHKPQATEMSDIKVAWLPTREAALAEEERAILEEYPAWNVHHSPRKASPSTLMLPEDTPDYSESFGCHLTNTENAVLDCLIEADGKTVPKPRIMAHLYGNDQSNWPDIKLVDVLVCKVRPKLANSNIEIKTTWGRGYRAISQ